MEMTAIHLCTYRNLIILCVFLCFPHPQIPSFAPPFLLFEVPKKLLQEQGPRPPVFSPPPSAHDPNIVGDGPPEGSSVRSPDAVPGKQNDMSFFTLPPVTDTLSQPPMEGS